MKYIVAKARDIVQINIGSTVCLESNYVYAFDLILNR